MAHIETRWVCPVCRCWSFSQKEARACAASHVRSEKWAVSDKYPGKAVACNYRGESYALREADEPDLVADLRKPFRVIKGGKSGGE